MTAVRLTLKVDDAAMQTSVQYMARRGLMAASRRAVLKTARLGRAAMKADTRLKVRNQAGGYDPYSAANFSVPRVKTRGGLVSANTGFSKPGYIDRFLSEGTGHRYTKHGAYRGVIQPPRGIAEAAARLVDPQFEAIADLEIQVEIVKAGLE